MFGFLDDGAKTAARFYINNFQDKAKQEAIDLMCTLIIQIYNFLVSTTVRKESLLRKSPLQEAVYRALKEKKNQYSSFESIQIFVGYIFISLLQ
jgi:hypothetical protein